MGGAVTGVKGSGKNEKIKVLSFSLNIPELPSKNSKSPFCVKGALNA
jgi:hypothetical protein